MTGLEWNDPLERSGQVWDAALGNGLAHVHRDSSLLGEIDDSEAGDEMPSIT